MSSRLLAKTAIILSAAIAAVLVSETSLAASATGKIIVYHLNGRIADRGACIQLNPPVPGVWSCVYSDNSLQSELDDLFRDAYLSAKDCLINYDTSTTRLNPINWAQCM